MKAIKDCEWEVEVGHPGNLILITNYFKWQSWCKCGIDNNFYSNKDDYRSAKEAKRNWEKFAKLNKIKKWKYV